jgi:hypothetical protein
MVLHVGKNLLIHRLKSCLAFCVVASAISSKETTLISANRCATILTFAGTFPKPRLGSGDKNGASVSTISLGRGVIFAKSRIFWAFLKVMFPA